MFGPGDREVQLFRMACGLASVALVIALLLLKDAGIHSSAGIARGLAGIAIIAAALWAFAKYWRGDWDDVLLGDPENR
jgi:hypothetical protein